MGQRALPKVTQMVHVLPRKGAESHLQATLVKSSDNALMLMKLTGFGPHQT